MYKKIENLSATSKEDSEETILLDNYADANDNEEKIQELNITSLEEIFIDSRDDNSDINSEKAPVFLYERILNCIDFLNNKKKAVFNDPEIEERVKNEGILKKLLPFNLMASWTSAFGAYPTLKYINNYVSRDIILHVARLNKELLTKTNFLAELMTNLKWQGKNIDHDIFNRNWQELVKGYGVNLSFSTYKCLGEIKEKFPEIKLDCPYKPSMCYFINSTEEICSFAKQMNVEFSSSLCNHYKDRMCFWFEQGKIITSLQAEITFLNHQIDSLNYIPSSVIWGVTGALAVGATLATAYYGYSYYKNHQELKNEITKASKVDFNENNKHIEELREVCKKLKIEMSSDIDKLIEELKEHADILSKRREARFTAFKFFTQNKLNSDVSLKIIGYADLAPGLSI